MPEEGNGRTFWQTLQVQCRVISAVMIRGALSRYGHENLGFFWLMGEPLLMTCGVMAMWSMTGMDHGHGVGIIPFVLTGYTMLTLWRHLVAHSINSMTHNAGLLFHRNIKILDIQLSNVILESAGGMAAFAIAYVPLFLFGYVPEINDPLIMIVGWAFITWLGFSFGLILAGISEISHGMARLVPAFMYISIPATGAFYMLDWLPETAQHILSWSPLVHPFEMFRSGLFGKMIHAKYDLPYMILVCTVMTAVGITLLRHAKKHVHLH